ncbi:hypothetical protein JAAARDRAFT_194810 [Jaapia argillacea MUCL 33604]|uniref:DUF6534 domain-containing protein n=1 Tax=Jaapia argillacea MUCL 33604 TaxID=933084 RepID=A0A067Q2P5_9AGAM|nr:hypothetical protein JAAARDRAFT_194810 [Jaapia argillacea MUCL 33604]
MGVVDLSIGPILIGLMINVFLFGMMSLQCYLYFTTFKTDKLRIRALVWFLFVCDFINTIFLIWVLYNYTITNFGDYEAITHGNWQVGTSPFFNTVSATCVQSFFARRVYVLSQKRWLCFIICCGIVVATASGLSVMIVGDIIPSFIKWGEWQVKLTIVMWLSSDVVVDCLITTSLLWGLRQNKTGMPVTDDILIRLMRLTVPTGLVTAIWASINLVLYLSSPYPYHLIFNIPLAKLYSNCLMSALNARVKTSQRNAQGAVCTVSGNWSASNGPISGFSGIQVVSPTKLGPEEYELPPVRVKLSQGDETAISGNTSQNNEADVEAGTRAEYGIRWDKPS